MLRVARHALRTVGALRPVARPFSAQAAPGGTNREQLLHIQKTLIDKMAADGEKLKQDYGGEFGDKVWMTEYYKHKDHKYTPAAARLAVLDKRINMPTVATKSVVFFSHVLRDLPTDAAAAYAGVMQMVIEDAPYVFAVLHHTNTPQSQQMYGRFGDAIRRGGNDDLKDAAAHIAATPVVPVHDWALPFEDARLPHDYKRKTYPWEIAPSFKQAKDQLPVFEYTMMASTAVLEANWAAFYATGDKLHLRRVLGIGACFGEFLPAIEGDLVPYWLGLEEKLPEALTKPASGSWEDASRVVRAQLSRVAIWSLIMHSRRHQAIVETLADEVALLSNDFVEASARDPKRPIAHASAEQVRWRMDLLPSMLSLMSRVALDQAEGGGGAAAAAAGGAAGGEAAPKMA